MYLQSAVTLVECLNNLLKWTQLPLPTALRTVTATPARMLGLERSKGTLAPGADADLVVLDEVPEAWGTALRIHQVWKFGIPVHTAPAPAKPMQARL